MNVLNLIFTSKKVIVQLIKNCVTTILLNYVTDLINGNCYKTLYFLYLTSSISTSFLHLRFKKRFVSHQKSTCLYLIVFFPKVNHKKI